MKKKKKAKNKEIEELRQLNTVYVTVVIILALGMIIWGIFGGAFSAPAFQDWRS